MIEYLSDVRVYLGFAIAYLIYIIGTYSYDLDKKLGCKGPRPIPFFGNMFTLGWMGMHEYDKWAVKKFGKVFPFYLCGFPMAVVSDIELMKQILVKESKSFTDRFDLGFGSKESEKMLTRLKGKDWERVRSLVSPAFTSGKLKKMSSLISESVELLEKRLLDTSVLVDMKEVFGALTMDVIAKTMFGMQIDTQNNPNHPFVDNAKKLFSLSLFSPFIFIFVVFPKLGKFLMNCLPTRFFLGGKYVNFFRENLERALEERRKSSGAFCDILALMLNAEREEVPNENDGDQFGTKTLTSDEIKAQSMIFLLAGYETTAATMSFVSYFLAMNPTMQQEVYEDIVNNVELDVVTYDSLTKMTVLDAAISESLRICPPAARIDRVCTHDVTLSSSDGKVIHAKRGDTFTIPVYAIHTDPDIWPDPDRYNLHRFTEENKGVRGNFSFMPFGMGPRNCVGMRFALLEAKWALATVLLKFQFLPSSETPMQLKFKATTLTAPVKPILLNIRPRG